MTIRTRQTRKFVKPVGKTLDFSQLFMKVNFVHRFPERLVLDFHLFALIGS